MLEINKSCREIKQNCFIIISIVGIDKGNQTIYIYLAKFGAVDESVMGKTSEQVPLIT